MIGQERLKKKNQGRELKEQGRKERRVYEQV